MWVTILLFALSIYFFYRLIQFWIITPWLIHRDLSSQGVPGRHIPIFGDLFRIRQAIIAEKPLSYSIEAAKQFGDYYRMSGGPIPILNISDPSLITGVLKTNASAYRKSIFMETILGPLIGTDNLLVGENEMYTKHRRSLNPVFQQQNINSMIPLMIEITDTILNSWEKRMHTTGISTDTIDIRKEMALLTLSMICGCVFGKSVTRDKQVHDKVFRSVTTILNEVEQRLFDLVAILPVINRLPLPGKLRIDKSLQDLRHMVETIINERKAGLTKSIAKGLQL